MSEKCYALQGTHHETISRLNFALEKVTVLSETALLSSPVDTWNPSNIDFSPLWPKKRKKYPLLWTNLSSIRFLVVKPNGPRYFAIGNVKNDHWNIF